jgi:hypothetical protein
MSVTPIREARRALELAVRSVERVARLLLDDE